MAWVLVMDLTKHCHMGAGLVHRVTSGLSRDSPGPSAMGTNGLEPLGIFNELLFITLCCCSWTLLLVALGCLLPSPWIIGQVLTELREWVVARDWLVREEEATDMLVAMDTVLSLRCRASSSGSPFSLCPARSSSSTCQNRKNRCQNIYTFAQNAYYT